jgi:hypothetical protein
MDDKEIAQLRLLEAVLKATRKDAKDVGIGPGTWIKALMGRAVVDAIETRDDEITNVELLETLHHFLDMLFAAALDSIVTE